MPAFTASRPNMKIVGAAVQPFVDGLGAFAPSAKRILAGKGIPELQPGGWYALDAVLEALREASKTFGPATLYKIGQATTVNAPLPPNVKSVEDVINLMNGVYGQILQGASATVKPYQVTESKPGFAKVVVNTPWQCDVDRGILAGIVGGLHKSLRVEHDGTAPCRGQTASSCTYTLTWMPG